MTGKSPYISLLLACVLGIGAWFVMRPSVPTTARANAPVSGPVAPGNVAFAIDPASIVAIMRSSSDDPDQSVHRQIDRRWLYDMPGGGTWPTDSQAIYTLLRTISETRATGQTDANAKLTDDAVTMHFIRADKSSVELRAARTAIGGNRMIQVVNPDGISRTALVSARFANTLIETGPAQWRLHQAIPGMGRDISRVMLANHESQLSLARTEGQWVLREPLAAPGDRVAIETLLDELAQIEVVQFFDAEDAPALDAAGLVTPSLMITVERDMRTFDATDESSDRAQINTLRRTLAIGSLFDPADRTFFARAGDDDASGTHTELLLVRLSESGMNNILDPLHYVSRSPMTNPPTLVQLMVIRHAETATEQQYRRGLDGWELRDPEGVLLRMVSHDEAGAIDTFLATLAAPTTPIPEPHESALFATIDVLGRDGNILASIELALDPATDAPLALANMVAYRLQGALPFFLDIPIRER